MSIFRSKKIFAYPESGPAVHYIPSSSNATAFGDAVPIGARTSGSLFFKGNCKKEYKQKPLIIIFGEKII
ncbi:hypothetical protein [Chryseobacterium salivictor]|uniref:Uncharacterized protein n=1 Tax=Chryseobacterium salivictor TaxID=2547600 RepID=A0A4P6ZCC0_9FLAO|nr:hypothetical protein [Chryseobacterium salivictor]QBO57140.1 hypothetical protein NBC122_00285 [Chryseobacterium salivictor]